jgi:long-chain acyl-CoA synthetase
MKLSEIDQTSQTGNVANLFDATAQYHGDALAVEMREYELTHAELQEAAKRFACGLREYGIETGETLLLYLPNCPEYVIASIGAFRAGVIVSPVNPQYKVREISYQLKDTDASVIVTHPALRSVVDETLASVETDPLIVTTGDADSESVSFDDVIAESEPVTAERKDDDTALLPYTSGTTGRPKGVELTHRNFRTQLLMYLDGGTNDLDHAEDLNALLYLPLHHITGFTHTLMQPLVRGGTAFLRNPANWDASDAMATIEEIDITHFVGVTAMYVDMVNSDGFGEHDLTSLVSVSEGGAKMSVAVQREFEASASVGVSEGYGLTETTGATHTQEGSTFGLRHGSIGQPLRMVDCRIVNEDGEDVPIGEEGELLVRGPQIMDGYHAMPDATAEAFTEQGYFRTGDIARRDHDNYYEIVDRKKHQIVSAGYNIYPSEVEALLDEHEAVAESAVVGVPDERRNEVPIAYVVTRPDYDPGADVTAADLKTFCLSNLAEYKHPREIVFTEELPRTTSGKIQKFKLIEEHESE